jgi:Flp pilus assembly protein TadD
LGALLGQQKKYAEAESELEQALKLKPNDAYALNYLGYYRIEQGKQMPESLQMIERALKAEPTNASFLDSLGWAYFKLGWLEQAEQYLTQAAGDNTLAGRIQARIQEHLGDLYQQMAKAQKARVAWQKALTLTGDAEQRNRLTTKLKRE